MTSSYSISNSLGQTLAKYGGVFGAQVKTINGPERNITFKDVADIYFELRKDTPSASGLKGTMNAVLSIIDGSLHLSNITGKHLIDFVEHRKSEDRKPQTIKHGVQFISAVMKHAKREGYTIADVEFPTISVKPTRLRYLALEEEKGLLREPDPLREGMRIPSQGNRPHHIL